MNKTLEQFCSLTYFLGEFLGQDYEIVLHDLSTCQIIAIAHGEISGRKIGDVITDAADDMLVKKAYEKANYMANYKGVTADGKLMRSSTFFVRDEADQPIGLLCINFDETRFIDLHDMVLSIAHPLDFLQKYSSHTLQNKKLMVETTDTTSHITENLTSDINVLMRQIYRDVTTSMEIPEDRITQEERIAVVARLEEQGFFKMKGSVPFAAKQLQCSAASIYRYLGNLKNI